jgi:aldehyde:ferredoxin oxidoreductase
MRRSSYGFAGNILRIDLSKAEFHTEPTGKYVPKYLGGRGMNQWILLQELDPSVTPFEPENILCYGAGALVGTLVPGAARISIDSKNALTSGIGSGNSGGWFAAELKYAGYDNIVIQGKAREPVYLWIEDDKVFLKAARDLWGRTTEETIRMIKEDLGQERLQILCIGPAGENMARSACIVVSGSRVVGRCGLGAIMGSKNLKAIAVKGNGSIDLKQAEEFMARVEEVSQRLRRLPGAKARREFGTLAVSPLYNDLSALSYRNFYDDHIPDDHLARISHEVFHHVHEVDRYACTACPTACGHVYSVDGGPYSGTRCHKAEANSVWNFGGKLAVEDAAAILKAQEQCGQLGLDIDNASSVIAWAIDCFQNEIISREDTDGLDLHWGNHGTIMELLRKIAYREGFGNILAQGSLRASQIIGKRSEKFAFHMKGQDLIEGIRSMKGWALGVVVSARGGAHTRGALATESRKYSPEDSQKLFGIRTAGDARTYEGKPQVVCYFEYVHSLLDSLGVCFFTGNWTSPEGITPEELADFFSLSTGIKMSVSELWKTGERIHNVEKMFNVYHAGFTRDDDRPPRRLMEEPIKSGPLKGELLKPPEWEKMLTEYYNLHGWDPFTSWPRKDKLKELELPECIEKLEQAERKVRPRG